QAIARLESDWQIDESGDIEFDEVSDAVEDVSQKMHELQDSLSKALEEGQGYALAKENLLTGMSHEMRTPMNCVIGMSSLLLEGTLDSNQRNQALAIQSSGRQLLGLIDDVLHLAQLESRTVELEQRSFALLPAVGSVLDTFRSRAEQKDIEFSINLESGAPECVSGDQLRLQQILTNVLDNAIAFTPKGQISVYMTSERFGTDEVWIRFEIRDTGSGIPREAHKRIFETFEQADMTPTRRHGGAGLGLSISKRLVELMEGEIGFDSSPGEGTRLHFSVILKLPPGQSHRLESQPLDDVAPALPVSSSEEAEPRPRVLVVEHDEINQRIMRSILSQLGCDVVLAETGFDGIDLVRRDTYALIFMECLMPVMDGYQATRAIRSGAGTQRRVPIIALTASDLRGASKACLAAGMNDVIAKPIGREAVARVLRRWSRDPLPSALPSDF
ncbi:MAG: signal transduction histidine kinase/CheY-like chemotaxis protein, partial [Planctomycetota bacterium]